MTHPKHQIDGGLVDCEDIGRCENPDIGNSRFGCCKTRTIAIDGHAAHDIDKANALTEKVARGFSRLGHGFHQVFFGRPLIPRQRDVADGMDLLLADATVGAPDGDVFHRTAEAAHGVTLKVR